MSALTPRQEKVLRFVADCVLARVSPGPRHVDAILGARGQAESHLRALESKGFIRRSPKGIQLTVAARELVLDG